MLVIQKYQFLKKSSYLKNSYYKKAGMLIAEIHDGIKLLGMIKPTDGLFLYILNKRWLKMNAKRVNQSDYMSLQLMEIEQLRINLSHQSPDSITFNEAAMLWFSQGHADVFRKRFQRENKSSIVIA